jgi:hypothetical protein
LAEKSDNDREKVSEKKEGDDIESSMAMCVTRRGHTHPKRLRKPNISTNTPIVGHLKKTRSIPPRKQVVPRSLFLREKK